MIYIESFLHHLLSLELLSFRLHFDMYYDKHFICALDMFHYLPLRSHF